MKVFILSLLFACVSGSQSEGVSRDYVIQNRSVPKPKVVVGKSDQSMSRPSWIYLPKIRCHLVNIDSSSASEVRFTGRSSDL